MLTYIANRYIQRVRMINFEEQLLMAYGGLRGAIAFSLAIMLEENHVKHARIFITTSLFIVLFTVFVLGSTTKPVVRWLEVQLHVNTETSMFIEINNKVVETVMSGIEEVAGHRSVNYWNQKIIRFNEKYLKGILTRGDGHSFKDTFELIYAGFIPQRQPKEQESFNDTTLETTGVETEDDATGLTFGMDSILTNNNNESPRVVSSSLYFTTETTREEDDEGVQKVVQDNELRQIMADPSYTITEKENISSKTTDTKDQETTFISKKKAHHLLDRSPSLPPHVSKSESCLESKERIASHVHDKSVAYTTALTSTTTTSTITITPSKKKSSFKELIRVVRPVSSSSTSSTKRISLEEIDLERRFIASAFSRSAYYQLPERDEVDSDFSSTMASISSSSPGSHHLHHLTAGDTNTGTTASGGSTASASPSSASTRLRRESHDDFDSFGSSTASKKWASARLKLEKLAISPVVASKSSNKHSKTAPSTPSVVLTTDKTSTPLKGRRQEADAKELTEGRIKASKGKTAKDLLTGSASFPTLARQEHQQESQQESQQQQLRDEDQHGRHLHAHEITEKMSHETDIAQSTEQSVSSLPTTSPQDEEVTSGEECVHFSQDLSQEDLEPLRRVLLSKRKSKQFQDLAEALLQQKKKEEQTTKTQKESEVTSDNKEHR